MSLLSKQLNDLELLRDSLLLRDNHTAKNTVCEAIDTIKALSAKVQAQNLHDGWHVVADGDLPEETNLYTDYLVTVSCESWKQNKTMVMTFEERGRKRVPTWCLNDRISTWNVIAWKPLPAPYKES